MQRFRTMALAVTFLASICATAMAQTSAPAANASDSKLLKPEELDQLVAPIALYPDPLLAEVLMASTYPIDIVNAERWLQNNKNLGEDQLRAAADKQSWDQSVKALLATPSVLELMNSKLDWTQKLGDAVLAQQTDVMDAVQRLRARAQENNKLNSTNEQTVRVEQVQNRQIIAIEPTQPDRIYVPYYDPGVVYGSWPYPAYPPYYWPVPGYIGAGLIAGGIAFGAGYALGRWAGGWGGGFNWTNNNININRSISGAGTAWQRGSGNRQGLGNRGRRQQGVNFGNRGGNLGNRGGAGNRGNLGNRGGGNRGAGAGNRGSRGGHVAHRGGGRQNLGGGARAGRGGVGRGGGGGFRGGGRGGFRGGGGGFRGGRGGGGRGGRRSDIMLKHDIIFLGRLDSGLGFYRFSYNGSNRPYVGVIAQEVQRVMPQAVERGRDGYLRVQYEKLGLKFESYDRWVGEGAQVPYAVRMLH